jgi:hypothetical protein
MLCYAVSGATWRASVSSRGSAVTTGHASPWQARLHVRRSLPALTSLNLLALLQVTGTLVTPRAVLLLSSAPAYAALPT